MLATLWPISAGELVDMTLALGKYVDQLGSAPVAERLGNLAERVEQRILRLSITHSPHSSPELLKELLDNVAQPRLYSRHYLRSGVMVGIRMFVDEGLGHSSYLVDLGDGTAAIVDPPRFPTEHLAAAEAQATAPRWTIDTHSHADYVTGSPALAAQSGVTFIAPAASKLETPHRAVRDEELRRPGARSGPAGDLRHRATHPTTTSTSSNRTGPRWRCSPAVR